MKGARMNIKQVVAIAAVAAVGALAPTAFAASGKDYSGPSCANIVSGDGKYSAFGGTEAFVRWDIQTESQTCKNATYTLVVLDQTGTTVLAQQSVQGGTPMSCPFDAGASDATCISFAIDLGPAATAPSSVCIYGYSANGSKPNDRAPDAGCVSVTLDGPSPGGFFN
jgi:hypothetical protein